MSFLTPLSMEAGFLNGAYGKQMAEKLIQDLEYQLRKLEKGPSNSQTEAKKREIRNKIAVAKSDYNEQYGKASYSSEAEKDAMESTLRIAPNIGNNEKESRLKVAPSPQKESSDLERKIELTETKAKAQLKKRRAQLKSSDICMELPIGGLNFANIYVTDQEMTLEFFPVLSDSWSMVFKKEKSVYKTPFGFWDYAFFTLDRGALLFLYKDYGDGNRASLACLNVKEDGKKEELFQIGVSPTVFNKAFDSAIRRNILSNIDLFEDDEDD